MSEKISVEKFCAIAATADEKTLRETDVPWPQTPDELKAVMDALINREHDYGTCVYAMSMSALAAFYYASHFLGVTGFQASCADMDFIARSRHMKDGFRIIDYGNLLYPQYCDNEHFPGWRDLLNNEDLRMRLAKKAKENLASKQHASRGVIKHWEMLARVS